MLEDLYLRSNSHREPLRIGLFLDDLELPRYFYQVVEDISRSNFAAFKVVVINEQAEQTQLSPAPYPVHVWRILKDPQRRKSMYYRWYEKFDRKRHPLDPDPFEQIDPSPLLDGVPRLGVTPIAKRFVHRFPPEALQSLQSYNLDVIFRFGFNILKGDVLTAAKYGIWSFHHGDNDYYRGGPPHYWELVEECPVSGTILQVLTEQLDAGLVLAKILFSTLPCLSQQANTWAPLLGSTHLAIQKLYELHEYGWDFVRSKCVPAIPYQGKRNPYRGPTGTELVRWLGPGIIRRVLKKPFQKSTYWHWRIGVRVGGPAIHRSAGEGRPIDLAGFRWLDSPKSDNWADPFIFEKDKVHWVFFEQWDDRKQNGVIAVAPVERDASLGEPVTCLDLPYHLSYPFVFEHQQEIFMLPDTVSNGDVELYRATRFPYEWKLEKVLSRGNFTDTSAWFDGERWWFFTCVDEPVVAQCLLFSADSLTGDWKLHPASPISTDVRVARNGGAVFRSGERLFRATQNCAGSYGRSMTLREIVTLNPDQYIEQNAMELLPDPAWGFIGMHTYNFSGDVEVIDGVKIEPKITGS